MHVFVGPDRHVPKHDKRTLKAVRQYMRTVRWDGYIDLGDRADLNCISAHNNGKPRLVEAQRLAADYAAVNADWEEDLEIIGPKAWAVQIQGNHEHRAVRLADAYPALAGSVEPENCIPVLKSGRVKWLPFWSTGEILTVGKAAFIHGDECTKYHAALIAAKYGKNIFYGHCFSHDTEILTDRGWVNGLHLQRGVAVATMNPQTHEAEFQVPTAYHYYPATKYPELISFTTKTVDLLVTPDHGLLDRTKSRSLRYLSAADAANSSWITVPQAARYSAAPGVGLTDDELRFVVWLAADGSFENKTVNRSMACRWHFRKPRKIERFRALVQRLGYSFSERVSSAGTTRFYLCLPEKWKFYFDKTAKVLPSVLRYVSPDQAEVILHEIIHTDGCLGKSTIQFSSSKEAEVDLVQEIAVLAGHRATKCQRPSGWILSINLRLDTGVVAGESGTYVTNNNPVWCVTVPNGTVIVRRNGKVAVTQNTHDEQVFPVVRLGDNETRCGHSLGCLCLYDQGYNKRRPNKWQQMFAHFMFRPNGFFNYYVIKVFEHGFIGPDGREYRG